MVQSDYGRLPFWNQNEPESPGQDRASPLASAAKPSWLSKNTVLPSSSVRGWTGTMCDISKPVVVPLREPDLKTRTAACAAGSPGLSAKF